ncbi:MAG: hypothetical protein IJ708_01290 [Clostridia bacterium]|nr:hypothetical protein [Clostridia bacterium]
MKRTRAGALILTLVLILGSLSTSYADETAAQIFDEAALLLTGTENVTLAGKATFSLDGETFKYVETTYAQDGVNSKWVLNLASPRRDGSLRENGFTVIANDRNKYGMEVCRPDTFVMADDNPQTVILRTSTELKQLISLGHHVLAQIPTMPEDVFSLSDDKNLMIRLEEEQIPDSVSNLLSLGIWLAVQRTMDIAGDSIATPPYPEEARSMEDYITPTQAIIDTTEKYELKQLSVDARMDEEGRFTEVNGNLRIGLHTFLEGVHDLQVSFSGQAMDYGTTTVAEFDPEEYGFKLGNGYNLLQPDAASMKWYKNRAKFILGEAGFDYNMMTYVEAEQEGSEVFVTLRNEDYSFYANCLLDLEGGLVEFRNMTTPWKEEKIVHEREDITDDMIEESCKKLNRYLETVQTGLSNMINGYMLDAVFQENEQTFVRLVDSTIQAVFVIQLTPEWRVDMLDIPRSNG